MPDSNSARFPTQFATFCLAATFCCPGVALADAPAPAVVSVPMLANPPSMNGVIDASWAPAAKIVLAHDYKYQRAATEPTTVYVAQDARALDVAFVATQREALTDRQATNGSNVMSDDYVAVFLYPNGTQGFAYSFVANPRGTRYQTSTENSAYSPQWTAVGHVSADGYVVTMRIPFNVVRNGGSTAWKVQFERSTVATGGLAVWTYSRDEHNSNDPVFSGTLTGVGTRTAARRPAARVQLYGLGELTTRANGGDTTRVGLDASIPVTPTSSFVATLHPDYSNVEIDQQTIAPTAFQRQYAEVRPFFTQAASFFGEHFSCTNCPSTLYTPSIPVFGQGYAYEGTAGPLSFAAFDAIGNQRNDDAQTLNFASENDYSVLQLGVQRVGVDLPGLIDDSETVSSGYLNVPTHLGVYTNIGEDRQNGIFGPTSGGYPESGFVYVAPTTTAVFNVQNIGADYLPVDGYVAQTDIYGNELYADHTFNFSPSFLLHDIVVDEFQARYHDDDGLTNQVDGTTQINFDFKNLVSVHVYDSAQGVGVLPFANDTGRFELLPFDANGFYVGYKANTTTPSYFDYMGGPYYHGHLDAWSSTSRRFRSCGISIWHWKPIPIAISPRSRASRRRTNGWSGRALTGKLPRARRCSSASAGSSARIFRPVSAAGIRDARAVRRRSVPSRLFRERVERQPRIPLSRRAQRVLRRLRRPERSLDASRALREVDPVHRRRKGDLTGLRME